MSIEELLQQEQRLDNLHTKKRRLEQSANSKTNRMESLDKTIHDLEEILTGEYEKLRLQN